MDKYGSIERRAQQLEKHVENFLEKVGAEKVNIIGHSMGGLDSRYRCLIDRLFLIS